MKKYIVNRVNKGPISCVFATQAENDEDLEKSLYGLFCCEADLVYAEYEELDDFLQGRIMCGNTVNYEYLKEKYGGDKE